MSKPLISIIIPVLNGYNFLDRCFSTLKKQNYSKLEIIFVDNGSSDGSLEKINKYCAQYSNYQALNCSTPGPGSARNVGIKKAQGEFISFLDVDDELEPNKHELLLEVFNKYQSSAMAIGRTKKIYSNGEETVITLGSLKVGLNQFPTSGLLWLQQFQHHPHISAVLIKKKVLIESDIYFPELKYGEDIAFSVQVGIKNNIIVLDELVSIYHRHSQSAVSLANQQMSSIERYFQFYEKFALPYFYSKRHEKLFNLGYKCSERIAYRLLMQLIKVEMKTKYRKKLSKLQDRSLISKTFFRTLLFTCLPYNAANKLNEKLNKF